jgi:uncharacterized cupin superfamily protein
VGITHFDEADSEQADVGHLRSTWTYLGDAAGSVTVGVNRIQVADGAWATPAHEHGHEEEISYVLAGRGIVWQDGRTTEIGGGDCLLFLPGRGAHAVHGVDRLDLLAFGTRFADESVGFPRQGLSRVGNRVVETLPGVIGEDPAQWVREAELGPPEISAPGERPSMIVNVDDVEQNAIERPRVARTRRDLGAAAGSVNTGLQYFEVLPGRESNPLHCHSMEEELFVILGGDGVLVLGEDEIDVRPGHVVSCPAATGVAHTFRAGDGGLTLLAYGTREPGDVCYYPRSNKIAFRGVDVIARVQQLDYWDGED